MAFFQRGDGSFFAFARGFAHNGHAAANQLFIAGLYVYHQVAVHLTQADHRAGGQHVQRGAALHACGAGDDLGAGGGRDADIGQRINLRAGAAGNADHRRAQFFGIGHCAQHIGRAAAGGDAHQHVVFAKGNAG